MIRNHFCEFISYRKICRNRWYETMNFWRVWFPLVKLFCNLRCVSATVWRILNCTNVSKHEKKFYFINIFKLIGILSPKWVLESIILDTCHYPVLDIMNYRTVYFGLQETRRSIEITRKNVFSNTTFYDFPPRFRGPWTRQSNKQFEVRMSVCVCVRAFVCSRAR